MLGEWDALMNIFKRGDYHLDNNDDDIKTTIAFYNFGSVGQNEIDNCVGSYSYPDMVFPEIDFLSNDKMVAFGDGEVILFEGTQKPQVPLPKWWATPAVRS